MIWIAVLPTLVVLQLLLGSALSGLAPVLRMIVMVTIAVPIVVYGFMPVLHRLRLTLVARAGRSTH